MTETVDLTQSDSDEKNGKKGASLSVKIARERALTR
jgi:hypothetical protein